MSTDAVPLLLLGDSRRRAIADRVARSLEEWQRQWLPDLAQTIRVDIEDVRARPIDIRAHEACCFQVTANGDTPLVLVVPRRSLAGLVGAPSHGAEASSRFADDRSLAAALEREALLRLASCVLGKEPAREPAQIELTRLPQGAVDVLREFDAARYACACVTLGDARCVLDALISPALAERLLPERPVAPAVERVERRRSAAAEQIVEVDGLLGHAEVSLADLAALAVGDVIVLQQSLSEAGAIAVRGGERVTGAAPGRVDGKRAIQIRGRAA
jgi:hypothetical protein